MKILKEIAKIVGKFILVLLGLALLLLVYFNIPLGKENEKTKLGVTFSSRYAADISIDWKKAYIEILDDLMVRKIRIPVYWDLVEKEDGKYDFSEVDWQLEEARKRNAEIVLVVGQKVPRWPECAIPVWLKNDDAKRKTSLLKFISLTVNRYKDNHPEIKYWQVENEPFLPFGVCPKLDVTLLDSEISLVRQIDPSREIILTDSGELSLWIRAAGRADIFGTTMYRTIYKEGLGYFNYPIGPRFFRFKYWLARLLTDQDRAVVIELQAEPWISGYTTEKPLEEQFKSMDSQRLKDNVVFARKVGFPEVYLWGVEWWYWLKVEKNNFELWQTARELYRNNNE